MEGVVYITMSTKKEKSRKQRGYYWAVVLPTISNFTGHPPEEVHEQMKQKFLRVRPEMDGLGDKFLSTEVLSTKEAALYYAKIRRFWLDYGLVIPEPNTVDAVEEEF